MLGMFRPVISPMTCLCFSSQLKNAPPVTIFSKVPTLCGSVLPSARTRRNCSPPNLANYTLQNLYLTANNFIYMLNLDTDASSISWLSLKPSLSSVHSHLGCGPSYSPSHLQIFTPPQYLLVTPLFRGAPGLTVSLCIPGV